MTACNTGNSPLTEHGESSWERLERLTLTAPVVRDAMATDLVYAFLHGWIELPRSASDEESSERLTRLYAVKRHVETNRG